MTSFMYNFINNLTFQLDVRGIVILPGLNGSSRFCISNEFPPNTGVTPLP